MSRSLRKARKEYQQGVRGEVHRRMGRYQHDLLCAQNGWKAWPENASEAERDASFDALLCGGNYTLYPPGYIEEPVETSGKLQPAPHQEERRWWELWK